MQMQGEVEGGVYQLYRVTCILLLLFENRERNGAGLLSKSDGRRKRMRRCLLLKRKVKNVHGHVLPVIRRRVYEGTIAQVQTVAATRG
jgi:hypothetical protein